MSQGAKKSQGTSVAKAGLNLLKRFVYDNYEAAPSDKRDTERQAVVGEVTITLIGESGKPAEQTKAFVRDTSRNGCGIWSRVALPIGRMVMVSGAIGAGASSTERLGKICHCRGATGTGFAVGIRFNSNEGRKA